MPLFMIDQVPAERNRTKQQYSESLMEKIETVICFVGIVFAVFAVLLTVIEIVSVPGNPPVY